MANLARKQVQLFASNASNNGQFGSAQAGTDVLSNDPDILQALPAYLNGWNDAVISGQRLPTLEEMQALQFMNSYQQEYIFQNGIGTWLATTEYGLHALVRDGSGNIMQSLVAANLNNALTDATKWAILISKTARRAVFTANGTFNVPSGVTTIYVSACAGGGGGGGSRTTSANNCGGGGGGGAGQSIINQSYSVTPGSALAVTIGAAGAAGAAAGNGGAGGNTSLGALFTLTGGSGGLVAAAALANSAGGDGGAGFPEGSAGSDAGVDIGGGNGGPGGSTPFGGGGGLQRGRGATALPGKAAFGFGAGGGGAGGLTQNTTSGGNTGGAGAPGYMFITW